MNDIKEILSRIEDPEDRAKIVDKLAELSSLFQDVKDSLKVWATSKTPLDLKNVVEWLKKVEAFSPHEGDCEVSNGVCIKCGNMPHSHVPSASDKIKTYVVTEDGDIQEDRLFGENGEVTKELQDMARGNKELSDFFDDLVKDPKFQEEYRRISSVTKPAGFFSTVPCTRCGAMKALGTPCPCSKFF